MIGSWKKEICAMRPDELQIIAPNVYMERKNIIEKQSDEDDPYTYWECDAREIGVSDYSLIVALGQVKVDEAIDDYTMQLIEEGVL